MTGRHPGRIHCRGNGDENNYAKLDPAMTSLPRLIKNAGYSTGGAVPIGVAFAPTRHAFFSSASHSPPSSKRRSKTGRIADLAFEEVAIQSIARARPKSALHGSSWRSRSGSRKEIWALSVGLGCMVADRRVFVDVVRFYPQSKTARIAHSELTINWMSIF